MRTIPDNPAAKQTICFSASNRGRIASMDTELENIVSRLNQQEKQTLRELLDRDLKTNGSNRTDRQPWNFGWAQGKIRIAADFDEPLQDFKENTE